MNSKAAPLETLSISVRFSPETNDHEVLLLAHHEDLVGRFCAGMIGLDPDQLLVDPCPLIPGDTPESTTIGRCECGVVGCGSVGVTISAYGDEVVWESADRRIGVRFDAAQYLAEVRRALSDFSWETPDRTAARLVASAVDRDHLARAGLELMWVSGRIHPRKMSISLRSQDGPHQLLLHVPWNNRSPAAIASECCRLLLADPRTWSDVEWSPQAPGLRRPRLAGPGWRRGPT